MLGDKFKVLMFCRPNNDGNPFVYTNLPPNLGMRAKSQYNSTKATDLVGPTGNAPLVNLVSIFRHPCTKKEHF